MEVLWAQMAQQNTESDNSALIRALDEDERKQFQEMGPNNQFLLEIIKARNLARNQYMEFHQPILAQKEKQKQEIRSHQAKSLALGRRIAELKKKIEDKSNERSDSLKGARFFNLPRVRLKRMTLWFLMDFLPEFVAFSL